MSTIKYQVVNCNSLTIRKSPSKKSKAVGYLKNGDYINVIKNKSKTAEGILWHKISKGYVSNNYLKRITPNYLKRVQKNADLVYNKIVEMKCKHKGGAYSYDDIKKKRITNCGSAVSAVLQESGVLKKGRLVNHTPKATHKQTVCECITGTNSLISGTYRIVKINSLYKDISPSYKKKGIVYVYNSNIAINAGDDAIYSCNNGWSQQNNGIYIRNRMKSGYCFTNKILYAIIPNE